MSKTKRKVSMPAGIRNKMMAAVSMLMISSIMMVSSTYAWFTLSTAPEVKNISTTVAGNGSLEIALMPADGMLKNITSGFASNQNGGTVDVLTANTTWGNIINLSDARYGLSKVVLNPAQLNLDTNNSFEDAAKPLAVATYGFDGRIDELSSNTAVKTFADGAFTGANAYGVRAIGEVDNSSAAGALGNTYGYVVDLAFRLNTSNNTADAPGAGKLLLQTDAIQRIYNGENASGNQETLGGGSYMSFNANGTGTDMTKIMSAVRVTFVQNYGKVLGENEKPVILGTAKLDLGEGKVITEATGTKARLYLCETTTSSTTADDGTVTESTTDAFLEGTNAVLIPEMTKNAAVQVSAIVWLDGNTITNADVAAIKVDDVMSQATLNLQFATDVKLTPANNNALYNGSAE